MNGPSLDMRSRAPALLFALFVVSACGLTYELLAGAMASYLLGSAVLWYSLTIGTFLTAMGGGAWLSRFVHRDLLDTFVAVEIALGVAGGIAGPLLFLAFATTSLYEIGLFATIVGLGAMVGVEIPLLTRWLEPHGGLRGTLADVLAIDYLGALAASIAFPLLLLPWLGLVRTWVVVGLVNVAVAGLTLGLFRDQLARPRRLLVGVVGGAVGLLALLAVSGPLASATEQALYRDTIVHAEQSPYQRLVLTQYRDDRRLYLDGHLQLSSRDEHRYHEALVHPALAAAAARHHVLLLGAGDGMAAREVLRWPDVQRITLVDLDPAVTELARTSRLLTELNEGSLEDPRLTVVHADAFTWLAEQSDRFDVVVCDFPDPHNESLAKLYSTAFYSDVVRHLSPGGVVVTQATSPTFARDAYWTAAASMEAVGLRTASWHVYVPSFGDWGFHLGAADGPPPATRLNSHPDARFLTPAVLEAAQVFDPEKARPAGLTPSTLDHPVIADRYQRAWAEWF